MTDVGPPIKKSPSWNSLRKLHFKDEPETDKKLQMSFGGCGFLGMYHVGVGKCVVDHAPNLFMEFDSFYGASAGAITAVCAACRSDPMVPYGWVKKTFDDSRKYWFGMFNPGFDLYSRLRAFLESFLPPNAHRLCRDVVKISLTVIGESGLPTNWLVSDFKTRKELINIIIASSFIPGYAGFRNLPLIRGKRCCDGGFTSNIPCVSDPDVITVSPFAGFCDICPRNESYTQHMINLCDQPMLLSPTNLYRLAKSLCPTSWEELEELYHQGYKDCLFFLRKEGLVPDPIIQKRKSICSTSTSPTEPQNGTTTMSCDLPNPNHSRMSSLTLSANGEFFICDGERERNSVASLPLEDVERGLDLRGTEKATNLIRQYGRRESLHYDTDMWEWREEEVSVVSRIAKHPLGLVKYSWNSLLWMMYSCSLREVIIPIILRQRKQHGNQNTWEEEENYDEGLFGSIISSSHSSMLVF